MTHAAVARRKGNRILCEVPNLVHTLQPIEAVQFQTGSKVHFVDRELLGAAAIEQHQGAPVLLTIRALYLLEKLDRLLQAMLMHHWNRCISFRPRKAANERNPDVLRCRNQSILREGNPLTNASTAFS